MNQVYIYLVFHLSSERTLFICYHFFKQLPKFGNKLVYTEGALVYDAYEWLRLKNIVYKQNLWIKQKIENKNAYARIVFSPTIFMMKKKPSASITVRTESA